MNCVCYAGRYELTAVAPLQPTTTFFFFFLRKRKTMAGFLAMTIHLVVTIVDVGEEKFHTHFYFDYFDIVLTYDMPSITARHPDAKQCKKRRE